MPKRFEAYRMRDGVTGLNGRYFNPIWQDLDLRLAALEAVKLEWEGIVQEVTDQGLARIDGGIQPVLDTIGGLLAALEDDYNGLRTQITGDATAGAVQALHDAEALTYAAYTYDAQGRVEQITETVGGTPRLTAFVYNAQDRLSQLVVLHNGIERTEAYGYDAEGRIDEVIVTEEAV